MSLEDGEQYFLTLLHEIGHFKVKAHPTKEYLRVKERVQRNRPDDIAMQACRAGDYLRKSRVIATPRFYPPEDDLMCWVPTGRRWLEDEYKAWCWALREFIRRRKHIREIPSYIGAL